MTIQELQQMMEDIIHGNNLHTLNDLINALANKNDPSKKQLQHIDKFPEGTRYFPMPLDEFEGLPSFKKTIGMESVIDQLQGFLNYLSDPLSYVGVGKVKPPQGVLFYGVPGTGKTFFTRALAKEAGRQVGFYETNAAEFVYQTLVGDGPRFVKKLFEDVRLHNKKEGVKASIIFIDECEEAFKYLNKTANSSSDLPNVVNQFKTELTSTKNDPKKPILIIGATNYFDKIDEAIKSRFTYHIEIKVGHATARAKYLDLMINVLRKNPFHEEALEYLLKTVNPFLDKFDAESRSNRRLENMIESSVINMNNRLSAESRAKQKEIDDKTKKLQLEANTLSLSQEEKDQLQKDIQELKTQLHNRKIKLEQIVENESQMAQIKQQETKIEKETAEKKAQQIILEEKIAKLNFEIEFLQEELNKLNEKQSQPKPLQPPTSSTLQTSESNASSTPPQDVTPTPPNSEQQPQQPNPEAEKLKQQTKDKQKEKEELLQKEDPLKLEEDITKLVQKLAQLDQEKKPFKAKVKQLQKDLEKEVRVVDLRAAFYQVYGMKILNTPEERCNELQELAKVYNKRNTQVLYSTQAMHYFNQTLNPKINQLMEEAQCDKLIAYFVEASKRKFLETKQTLQQNDLDEVFKEVYGGLDELTQKLNNNYK